MRTPAVYTTIHLQWWYIVNAKKGRYTKAALINPTPLFVAAGGVWQDLSAGVYGPDLLAYNQIVRLHSQASLSLRPRRCVSWIRPLHGGNLSLLPHTLSLLSPLSYGR